MILLMIQGKDEKMKEITWLLLILVGIGCILFRIGAASIEWFLLIISFSLVYLLAHLTGKINKQKVP